MLAPLEGDVTWRHIQTSAPESNRDKKSRRELFNITYAQSKICLDAQCWGKALHAFKRTTSSVEKRMTV
jgi:hypothetical protein